MGDRSALYPTTVVAAHLAGVDTGQVGLPRDRWQEAGLPTLGVDLEVLAAALAGQPGPVTERVALADRLLGGAGPALAPSGSPFDAVRLLSVNAPAPPPIPASPAAGAPPFAPVPTLQGFSARALTALRRSGQAAPSSADVPLVDYVRARVALVVAGERWAASGTGGTAHTEPMFLWVGGDLSGIQAYLYDIAHIGEGGVARRLRARSLFLQLLAENTAERLRRTLKLLRANVVMRSGGKFYLVAPDTPEARAVLADEQGRLDRWLLAETHGEVALPLAWLSVPANELASVGAGAVLRRLEDALARRKAARFAAALCPHGRWDESAFLRPAIGADGEVCESCHKMTAGRGSRRCRRCDADTEMGRALPAAEHIWLMAEDAPAARGISLPGSVAVVGTQAPAVPALLRIPLARPAAPGQAGGIGAYVPVDERGAPLTFEQMLGHGAGRALLGFLKMDVDRLGEIFAYGLRRDDGPGLDTLPRLAAISRLLDEFFGRRLTRLIRQDFPFCYQVYAGGDDVLVIGPWWDTVRLALRVRREFCDWVQRNPEITISAGLTLAQRRTPVAQAARDADAALASAKRGVPEADAALLDARRRRGAGTTEGERRAEGERPAPAARCVPAGGRNCAALLGDVLSWEHLGAAMAEAERLAAARPPGALLHRLLALAGMWREYRDGDPAGLRLFPYLAYELRRNIDPRRQPELWAWSQALTDASYRSAGEPAPLEHLGLVARLALLLTEGERA